MTNFKQFHLRNFLSKIVFFSFLFFVFSVNFAQIANATVYSPGATLEPDCAPGSPSCGVSAPAITNISNTNLTLDDNRTLTLDGYTLTFEGASFDIIIDDNGNLSVGGGTISTPSSGLSLTANAGASGVIQIGTGGAGSTTPDLLVTDVKSDAGDPAGTNGAVYYNADTNRLRCYENGAWDNCVFRGTDSAQNLTLARIGNSTFSTLQQMQNVFHSAGWTSGGTITDAGGETINISSGTGLIRTSNNAVSGQVNYFDWSAMNGISIPTNSIRYVGVEYNAGSPQVTVRTSANWNLKTDFSIGVVVNEGGVLSIYSDLQAVGDHAANMIQREYETMPLSPDVRGGGLVLGESGTRNITLSAGAVWDRLNRYTVPALNTSITGNFDAYYMDGSGGFTKVSNLTQWPNTQYDDTSGTLATMTDGYYATLWFYIDTNARVSMVYGMDEYTTSSLADSEMAPDTSMLPNRLRVFGKLLGKIVFQKSAGSATEVTSLISMSGSSSASVTNHANLSGLDYASSGHTGFANAIAGVNSNITSASALASITPSSGLTLTGAGASVWSTSSGALTLDSAAALNLGTTNATSLSVGKAGVTTTNNGNFSVVGNFITPRGTDYTTTGTQNDVDLGIGSYFHYAGNGVATFTGIAGGSDGKLLRILNDSAFDLTLKNADVGSLAINRIETPNGQDLTIPPDMMVALIYDSESFNWHLASQPATSTTVSGFAFVQNGNAYGTTATLGTTDANGLNLITSGATRFSLASGASTLTGTGATTFASDAGSTLNITSGTTGILNLDSGSTGAVNIGTNANAKTITIGNSTGATTLNLNSGSGGINLTGNSAILDMTGTGTLGLNTTTNRAITTGTGLFTVGGDLSVAGDDLFMGTNTSGAVLVADGTNFNPVVLSGDATVATNGTLTLNYAGAQSADTSNKGFLTSADWNTFNNKQAALGFTAENVANKDTDITLAANSDTKYPSQKAVKTYIDNIATGINWQQPVELINVIADVASPVGSPVHLDGYIINTGGNTGAWASFAPGDLVQYQTDQWVKIKSMIVGDRFGVAFRSATIASGSMAGKENYKVEITGGTAGAYTYTFTAPSNNDALFVQNVNAYYHNVSFIYSSALVDWVQLSASTDFLFGNGTSLDGRIVSIGPLIADWDQTGAFNINTAGNINLNGGTLATSASTANLLNTNATTLNIGGAATSINLGAAGATVAGAGALTINSGVATAFTLDSGTTGALNIGTGSSAKTITFGNVTGSTALNINTGTGGSTYTTTNGTFNLNTGTGAINLGADATAKTLTIGNTTGATAVNINAGSGGINFGGNTTVSGSNTFTTGTGATTINSTAITLAGNSSILDMTGTGTLGLNTTTNRAITTGTGLLTVSGGETVNGTFTQTANYATPKGTDYVTTGTQNDVDLGTGFLFRYAGASTATFTGIAGGSDGRQIRIMNVSGSNLVLTNEDAGSIAANRILTTAGGNLTLPNGVSVGLQYDAGASRWRVVVLPATSGTVSGFAFIQNGNAYGATANLGTTDANGLNLITGGATRFGIAAGSATLTGTGATTITSSAALTLDATTALNLGTSTATSVAIGATGVTTTNNGAFTSTQTLTASNGLTLTTGALNLTATSGTLSLGSATLEGASPLVFDGVTADANKTTFAITDPTASRTITFPNSSITVNAALNISGTTLASNVVTSSLTAVGALSSGSIGAGFGTISTTNDITTSGNISTTGSGTIISAGSLTASNGLTLTTGALNLTATSGTLTLSGLSASSINSGANNIIFTSGNLNTTATGINNTAIGATTASTGAFTTLSSTGATNIATAGASNVTIATTGTGNVTVGNSTGTFALTSSGGLNVTTGGALTGVASIDTVTHSATAITFAGAGTLTGTTTLTLNSTGANAVTLDSTTTGSVLIGTGVAAKTITIGNATDDTFSLNSSGLNVSSAGALTGVTSITASGNISTSANISTTGTGTITSAGILTGSSDISVTGSWTGNVSTTATTDSTTTSTIATKALAYYVSSTDTTGNCSTGTKTFNITGLSATEGAHAYIVSKAIDGGCNSGSMTLTVSINGTTISTVANANTNGTVTENYTVAYVNGAWRILGTPSTADGADLAETYSTNDESIEAGDVVSLDSTLKSGIKKSLGVNDRSAVGIVSTMPAMVIGGINTEGVTAVPVALSGRVPVKVNTENGSISAGDYLTTSSVPGVAMKSNGTGVVIGQAMSPFDGSDTGIVLAFVKNFDLGNFEQMGILLGDISKTDGLDTLISTIQSEDARDPVVIIGKKISDGKEFLTDFVSARVTAIRGYFDEIFTKKVHTEEICVKKSDGNEVCVNGDQINTLLNNANIISVPAPAPEPTPEPTVTPEPNTTPTSDSDSTPASPAEGGGITPIPDPVSDPSQVPEVTPDPVPTSEPAYVPEPAPTPASPAEGGEPTPEPEPVPAQ